MRQDEWPVSIWKEKELLDGKVVDAGVVILQTSGCSHFHSGGCSMCGYNYGASVSAKRTDIVKQFDTAVRQIGEVPFLKLYTSGSFLDECEVSSDAADHILKHCSDSGMRLLFESRPEYVTPGRLGNVLALNEKIEIAIGLESANDKVLKYSVNKGFTVADYQRAAELLNDRGVDLRSYVLLKPPFLTEAEAVADSIATIEHASKFSATVSLNPVNVQKGTLVEKLWRNWAYRPPWLWSVLDVLKTADTDGKRLVCDPTGGGKERGAHNCGDCDGVILDSIKAYSLSQNKSRLGFSDCDCKEIWSSIMDLDGFVLGGTVDLQRVFRRPGGIHWRKASMKNNQSSNVREKVHHFPSSSFFDAKIVRIEDETVEVIGKNGRSFRASNAEENEKHGEGPMTGILSGTQMEVHLTFRPSSFEILNKRLGDDELLLSNDWGLGPTSSNYKFVGRLDGLYNFEDFSEWNPTDHTARFGFLVRVPYPIYADIVLRKGQHISDGCIIKGFQGGFEVESAVSYHHSPQSRIVDSPPGIRVPAEWELSKRSGP